MVLNHKYIKKYPEKITKIKSFIDQCDWNEIELPSHQKIGKSLN